jgi:FkbM family methyltransferase
MRTASHVYDVLRLAAAYGPWQTVGIVRSLLGNGPDVTFSLRGRSYVMPNGLSARYHLLESIAKLRRLSEFVRPDDGVIVDIGAHSGLFTAFALERALRATAICVEPLVEMVPLIHRNLAPFSQWKVVSAAVSDERGASTFYRARSSQESSLVPSTIRSESQVTTVQTVTLDEVCADVDQIDVMKIDVQGAEHLVLGGGSRTIPRVRTLLIEVSLADPEPHTVLADLQREFGSWRFVNPVYGGADLAFERDARRT